MKKNIVILILGCFFIAILWQNKNHVKSCCIYNHDSIDNNIMVVSSEDRFSGRILYKEKSSSLKDNIHNEKLAVKIALLLMESLYGKEIYNEKPYRVALLDSIWVVETSLVLPPQNIDSSGIGPGMEIDTIISGGVGHVEINKHTGEIYAIYHTK